MEPLKINENTLVNKTLSEKHQESLLKYSGSFSPQIIFDSKNGNANNYRIPALAYLGNGRLVACADERFFGCSDNPNRIDKVIRISLDYGLSWENQLTVIQEKGRNKQKSSAAIDPSLLYDEENKILFMLYSHTPAGVGILNAKKSNGYKNGYKLIRNRLKTYYLKGNSLYFKEHNTGVTIDSEGNLSSGGNIMDDSSPYREIKTFYLMLAKSKDGGKTWEKPICLNTQIKSKAWGFVGACPGNGIKIKNGRYKGRLVFPIYYGLNTTPLNLTFACIYSDDCGTSWECGEPPIIEGRFPKENPIIVPKKSYLSETQVVEIEEEAILAIIRNHHPNRRAMKAYSYDGGKSFSNVTFIDEIPQPICQISAISFFYNNKTLVATLNPASENKRENGTLRISEDGGKTFPHSKLLFPGQFIYSSLSYLGDGILAILYEDSMLHENIKFLKIKLEDIVST